MDPELVKALKAVRNGADPLTAYSAACGTWGNFLRAVKQQSEETSVVSDSAPQTVARPTAAAQAKSTGKASAGVAMRTRTAPGKAAAVDTCTRTGAAVAKPTRGFGVYSRYAHASLWMAGVITAFSCDDCSPQIRTRLDSFLKVIAHQRGGPYPKFGCDSIVIMHHTWTRHARRCHVERGASLAAHTQQHKSAPRSSRRGPLMMQSRSLKSGKLVLVASPSLVRGAVHTRQRNSCAPIEPLRDHRSAP